MTLRVRVKRPLFWRNWRYWSRYGFSVILHIIVRACSHCSEAKANFLTIRHWKVSFSLSFGINRSLDYYYRPQRSCGQGYVFTCVCHSVNGGVLSQHALQVVSQHALQQVSRRGACSQGVPGQGVCSMGGRLCGLLLWPSVVVFCYGLLVWPSGLVAFWLKAVFWLKVVFCYGLLVLGGSLLTDPFQPEGHNRRPPHQKALLEGHTRMTFSPSPPPRRWLLLRTVRILLECILVYFKNWLDEIWPGISIGISTGIMYKCGANLVRLKYYCIWLLRNKRFV